MNKTHETPKAEARATQNTRVDKVKIEWIDGDNPFLQCGCVAKAEVSYPIGNGNRRLEWLTSGGIWGTNSDDKEGVEQTESEQLADLADHLAHFGIETSAEQLRELV
jgi:hypothetical protein